MNHSWSGRTRRRLAIVAAVALTGVLAACSSGGGAGSTDTKDASGTVTYWSWTPGLDPMIAQFEKTYPKIKVKVVNAGQGNAEYAKLRTAVKAGSGVPDAVQVEGQFISTFANDLTDLRQYGITADGYAAFAIGQASRNGKILGLPTDTGPMGLVFRKSIFDKYGIAVPTTWAEFADAARKLHAADPNVYITNLAPNDPGQFLSMTAQAGSRPYDVKSDDSLNLRLNDAGAKQWADFWGPLIKEGVVSTDPDFTDQWYKGLANGTYASWITAAWGPVFLQGVVKDTSGDWRAAPLPQWKAGDDVSANWGGSTVAVPTLAKNKTAAAVFAKWFASSDWGVDYRIKNLSAFPARTKQLQSTDFTDAKVPFFGDQQIAKEVFIPASKQIDAGFQYSPFQDYVYSQMQSILGQAMGDGSSLSAAFDKLQSTVVSYAKDQGYKVTTK